MVLEVFDVVLVYAGLALVLIGAVALIKPLPVLLIRNRPAGAKVLTGGLVLGLAGGFWPVGLARADSGMAIDEVLPAYHFNEIHSIRLPASPERAFQALEAVTPDEVRYLRLLFALRQLPERILGRGERALADTTPLLDQMAAGNFVLLVDDPRRELVLGTTEQLASNGITPVIETAQQFARFNSRGYMKAAINFHAADDGGGWTQLTTETRVFITDPSTRRRFAWYWRLIYPGSALLRRTLLKAVQRRLEMGLT